MKKKYSAELTQEWLSLKQAGVTQQEIALRFGVSKTCVHNALKRIGRVKSNCRTLKTPKTMQVRCLKCDRSFETRKTRRGLPELRICGDCTKYNKQVFAGSLFL